MKLQQLCRHEEAQVALAEKSLSARELAYFSPRLGILNNIPFAIPFFTRAAIFQRFVASSQKAFRENNRAARNSHHSRPQLRIRRDHLAQDGFEQLQDVDLREKVSVTFIDKFGMEEFVYSPVYTALAMLTIIYVEETPDIMDCTRNSSRRSAKKCSTPNMVFGSRTRSMRFIPVHRPTPAAVSCFCASFYFSDSWSSREP